MSAVRDFALPLVTISTDIRNKGNPAQIKWRTERNWSTRQLYRHITNGFPFAVGIYRFNERRGTNFVSGQIIGLDFDDLSPELAHKLLSEEFVNLYASFSYTTPSHTQEVPRLRLIFVLNEAIEGKERYEISVSKMLMLFGAYLPDSACRDGARLFYGNDSPDSTYTAWLGHTLPIEIIGNISAPNGMNEEGKGELLPSEFIQGLERNLLFTGKKHGEFLECHCPIHPPDDSPSAAWHPDKHILWCFHEDRHYLAKDVGESLGVHLHDYLTPVARIRQPNSSEIQQSKDELPPLTLGDQFPQYDSDSIAAYAALNEYGDAKFLDDCTLHRLVYDRSQSQWYWWRGHVWGKDARGQTPELLYMPIGEQYARAVIRAIPYEIGNKKACQQSGGF